MNQNKPLVTIVLMAYNQEEMVGEAVRSVLAQSYDSLEIIISDDCSSDNTWCIICDEVSAFQRERGRNHVVLNRNEENLGIARHWNKVLSMIHGELIVCNAGDDISLPNRVEEIVKVWITHPSATVFCHGAYCIGLDGRKINNNIINTNPLFPLGAMMAYSTRVIKEFVPISEPGAWEDDVYARRGQMLGDSVLINMPLLCYRIGCGGISSGHHNDYRSQRTRIADGCLAADRQSRKDLESCRKRIGEQKYKEILELIKQHEQRYTDEWNLINARNPIRKVQALNALYPEYSVWSKCKRFLLVSLPLPILKLLRHIILQTMRKISLPSIWKL